MKLCSILLIITGLLHLGFSTLLRNRRNVTDSGYIEYYEGTLNVILAAPHGGSEQPSSIPDRDAGCWNSENEKCIWTHDCGEKDFDNCEATTVKDLNTKELSLSLRDHLFDETGGYPYLVINNLHRLKLDANRDKPEATFGEPIPEEAWEEFHQYIDQFKFDIGGQGLFLDLHGHGHENNWAELGYLISGSDLDSGDFEADGTSISNLASEVSISFEELLRGDESFGGFLEENDFIAVPAPDHPGPDGDSYFSGGYNTRRHGSVDSGEIDAIQIESSSEQRSDETRPQYSKALAKTIKSYLESHYPERMKQEMVKPNGASYFHSTWLIVLVVIFGFTI